MTSSKVTMPGPQPEAEEPGGFRTRVAREKRERMRQRLVQATVDAYLQAAPGTSPVIDDVVRVAGVSRGSFYKYFNSVDEIVVDVGQRLIDETLTSFDRIFKGLNDAGARAAAGPLLSLCHSAMDPRNVVFVSRVNLAQYLARDDLHGGSIVRRYLADARTSGALHFDSMAAAIDLTVGASRQAAMRILDDPRFDVAYIRELTGMVLMGLGMPPRSAQRAVKAAWDHFMLHAPELPWWRPVSAV